MSYDLYFTKPRIAPEIFASYFRNRPNYQVSDVECLYQNEDTGVYFVINYHGQVDADAEDINATASLCLNYYRPHTFGLEAADEIAAFVDHFGFSIHDPQDEGMGDGDFSRDGFLKGWNHGNEFGYRAVLRNVPPPNKVLTYPGKRLESVWKWNLGKALKQKSYGDATFVPRVFFLKVDERAATAVVWPDAIPELIPEVDFLVIGRDELAPVSFSRKSRKDTIVLPFDRIRHELEPYRTGESFGLPAYHLPAPQAPDPLRTLIRSLKPTGIALEGVAVDQVLNEEMVIRIRNL